MKSTQEILDLEHKDMDISKKGKYGYNLKKKIRGGHTRSSLSSELNALGLEFSIRKFEGGFYSTVNMQEIEKDLFQELETRLKLRALLARKKAEQFER
jgi:ribosomal protein S6